MAPKQAIRLAENCESAHPGDRIRSRGRVEDPQCRDYRDNRDARTHLPG